MKKAYWGSILILVVLMASPVFAAPYKILYLDSYHTGYDWSDDVAKGIKEGFASRGTDVLIKTFSMDAKNKPEPSQKEEAAKAAKTQIDTFKPDLVIASDDDAQQYVVKGYAGQSLPFVFCGVNADPEKYGYPASNITGTLERTYAMETLKVFKAIHPKVDRILLVGDASSVSGSEMKRIQENEKVVKGVSKVREIVGYKQAATFEEWKRIVQEAQGQADALMILTYHTIKDESGTTVPSSTILKWTTENNRLPELGLWEFAMKDGAAMGITISGYQHGYEAAKMASEILKGKKPGDIPIEVPKTGKLVVNTKRSQTLGITMTPDFLETAKKY